MAAALLAAPLIRWVDDQTRWTLMGFGPEGARAVLGALASSLLTFIVFTFSIILLVLQIAGSQLSPRIIARVFENRLAKLTLGVFVFSFAYTVAALGRIEDRVPQLPVLVAVLASLCSVALFFYLIQEATQSLRPVMILTRVANDTRRVIEAIYPRRFSPQGGEHAGPDLDPTPAGRTIEHRGRSGVVLAFDVAGAVEIATRAGCAIELVPQVGDFLAPGEDVFRLHGAGAGGVEEGGLRRCVALGPERALEKDPAFGFRIIVDIASKALSPAINDPTTGVLAIDQLHHLLHLLGRRQLDTGVVRDASGAVRLVYRTSCWEDFVTLAVTEIRLFGAGSPQVTRRLQVMFEQLVQVVPAERSGALRKEMALLRRTIDRGFADPEDRILAGVGDLQGFGSRQHIGDPGKPRTPGTRDCGAGERRSNDG
jgi:uncharacterized membrane protein